ncbi:response regulator transcription factor [Micromonospora wenchangensis]|uniref:response regulator transcription factor n=1 Tax=Micromonospora wenchangensis TaxID=1185415 RepID=UPI00382C9C16
MLVIEDRDQIAKSLTEEVRLTGHEAVTVATSEAARHHYEECDLLLLDLNTPGVDGIQLCRWIRARCATPIIAFVDPESDVDRVVALQAGADDCMEKPCQLRELLARIEAVMRRLRCHRCAPGGDSSISVHGLCMNVSSRDVRVHGQSVELTRKEFDLLYHLANHPGSVLSRERLMAEVWGDPTPHAANSRSSRTIDTHVSSLRSKIGSGWIRTVRGVGFQVGRG